MSIEIKRSKKLVNYNTAIKYLEKRVNDVASGKKPELLWLLEHSPVFTAGIRSKEKEILDKSIKIIKTSRGGKITYHGPGQKVVYFVLNLNKRKKDIRKLIRNIEKCIILTLAHFKINSFNDKKNIGIWVKHNSEILKIAAIGIRVKKWIAFHGFCINISNDLNIYKKIIPCGINNKKITNIIKLKRNKIKIDEEIIKNFLKVFRNF
tara:strand:+ start:93 stop:713 length:621 start_codon:yes stop_codon:yes gene_type:complete